MAEPGKEGSAAPADPVGEGGPATVGPAADGAGPELPHWTAHHGDTIDVPAVEESEHEHLRSLRTAASLTALVGAIHAVLFLSAFWLMAGVPGADASTADIVAFYESSGRRRIVLVGMYLMPFAGIAFIWFVVAMRMWVQGAARRVSVLMSNVQLVSGILYVALLFAASAASSVLAFSVEFASGSIDDVVAHEFPVFGNSLMLVFALRMAAMFVLATSTIGRASGVFPKWFAWSGYLVGLFLLLTATMQAWFALVFPAWLLVLSAILLARARRISPELMIARPRPNQVVVVRETPPTDS